MCKTDADLKLYTSLNYCIAIAETRTQAELENELRAQATIPLASPSPTPSQHGVRLMGVMLPAGSERKTVQRLVSDGMQVNEIPEFLRKQEPDNHDER